eukprot:scaffold3325_cov213-Alexandrium_tamarense.AAC.2
MGRNCRFIVLDCSDDDLKRKPSLSTLDRRWLCSLFKINTVDDIVTVVGAKKPTRAQWGGAAAQMKMHQ